MPQLSPLEALQYHRHLLLPEVGIAGQERLKAAQVLVIGVGGLGSSVAPYLAGAGVGRIGLIDFDRVDLSNLHRQILYTHQDIGRPKLDAAMERLRGVNPRIDLVPHEGPLTAANAESIAQGYDILVDGSDNFPTRYLVNDLCVLSGKPNVHGSIYRFEGRVTLFDGAYGPCYRCLYPDPPTPGTVPNCAEGGVLGVLPGIIGAIQAAETIKWILGKGESLVGRLLLVDALTMQFRELALAKNPDCPVCGMAPTILTLRSSDGVCGEGLAAGEITAVELKTRLDRGERPRIVDVREPHEYAICRLPGAELRPLREIEDRLHDWDRAAPILLYCHRGVRSLRVLEVLRAAGFRQVWSLHGGIDAWAEEIDPAIPRY